MTDQSADPGFESFRALALDQRLSPHEKVGFPDSYRAGKERTILRDVCAKLTHLRGRRKAVLEIGPGCGPLATALIELCGRRAHRLALIDSAEMLALLPDPPQVEKRAGRFPEGCLDFVAERRGRLDVVLAYSVLHYVFAERDVFSFLDRALELLAPGGQLLVGDVPNRSMRRRFFASVAGLRFHRRFIGEAAAAAVPEQVVEGGGIDDAVLVAMVLRARAAGFHAYLVPQARSLPMANRREDLLVVRP